MSDSDKRRKIYEINAMDIPQSEKAKLICQIMNPPKTEEKITSKKHIHCPHYNLYTYPVSKCCNKVYPCRLCHNENESHEINRHDIDLMKCCYCNCFQKVGSSCQNPECFKFNIEHKKFCKICNLWFDNLDKKKVILNSFLINELDTVLETFHCDDCGICRLGKKEDYKHCHKCNLCVKKDIYETHPCIVNVREQNCPICLKEIWNAFQDPPYILKCGHSVHTSCFIQGMQSQNYFCPICKKSITDLSEYWTMIDNHLSNQEMPEEFRLWTSDIYCNDCEKKSNAKYHFAYHKCQHCNGYNTVIDKLNKNEVANTS